jgi:xylitol oxidase
LKLDTEPSFDMQQFVYNHLPLDNLLANFTEVMGRAYSVSLFTHWTGNSISEVWVKHRIGADGPISPPQEWLGATLATENLHPVRRLPARPCTPQRGVRGPWYDRLPHFLISEQPSSAGDELHSEFMIPLENAVEAIRSLTEIGDRLDRVLWVGEIRTIMPDQLAMSTAYNRQSVAVHFSWKKDPENVMPVVREVERRLTRFDPRPHWGKISTFEPAFVEGRNPGLNRFQEFVRENDPERKFGNPYLRTLLAI